MSLLHKMLADLDARAPPGHAAPATAVSTSPQAAKARATFRVVTSKNPGPSQRLWILGALLVLILTIVAGIYLPERLRSHATSESAAPTAPEAVAEIADNGVNALDVATKAPEDETPIDFNAETELGDEPFTSEIEAEKARVLFLAQAAISDVKTAPKLPVSGSDPQLPSTEVDVSPDTPPLDIVLPSNKAKGHASAGPAKKTPPASASNRPVAKIKSKVGEGGDTAPLAPIKMPAVSGQALAGSGGSSAVPDEPDIRSFAGKPSGPGLEATTAISAGKIADEPKPVTPSATPTPRHDTQYTEALAFLDAGRVSDAEHALRQVLAHRPSHADARTALVRLLMTHDRRFEAQKILEDARNTLGIPEKLLLARIYLEQGQAAQAVGLLEAVDGDRSGDFYAALGSAYQRLSKFDRAVQSYQRAVLIEPNEGRMWLGLAIAFESAGNLSAAEEAYVRATASEAMPVVLVNYAQQQLNAIQRGKETGRK